ncbi:putative periplasmic binding protein-like I [Helianthus annuus]|uniref:Glutamate receptor n=1 Tax=Helianthus annuus TaxID=4232 RepID=A0A251U5P4_HELAN|nr:glutamate receptor 2.7 [Helianthus annuus]KAF5795468.1 putative periplasmic binding protein-like I [Helianthus annuus]KAJ0719268.1 putative periplasmic binding protein-like I [Helianthus annuus]KAJ0722503.1 putative periplasmic binding protein-like I [Helianthus annuus]KAJ0901705.1 putative periplasmic binding protein-like I [Helianthus annuus]
MQHRHHHAVLVLMLILILIPMLIINTATANANETTSEIAIGVILDMESSVGKVSKICIEMAIRDFYQTHNNYTTRIVPYFRDSKNDRVEAVSAAIQLIKDVKVSAIIGPQTSSETDFVVDIGNKTRVPILSLATTPSLSPKENPYFIRISRTSSSQAQPISALINTFPWREVVLVYQDGDFGTGFIPSLSEALLNVNVQIKHPIVISPFASDHDISNELHNIKTRQTRVFVVHLLPELASRFFKKAKQAGMMQEGYAWIITDVVTNLLHTVDTDSMQGVVGVKPHIPKSDHLKRFKESFKNHSGQVINVYGLWSYDATYALAMALERVGSATTFPFQQQKPVTDLDAIGISKLGPTLLSEMRKIKKLKGLTGDFDFVDRSYSGYEIVNIVGQEDKFIYLWKNEKATKISNEKAIRWPGGSNESPRGWEIPGRKLKVGYPEIGGFPEFIHKDDETEPKGFCVEVFKAVMKNLSLPHPPSYEYMPYTIRKNETSGSYDTLVEQIHLKKYDVVIGDVTIRAERSSYVDFTLPYTESGVSMIVPVKKDDRKNAWVFMRPLETQLWFTTCAFFIYTGVVVWVLEHRVNKEFRGRPYKQVGMIFWFSFSTLVFAHKEKMISNLSRFVVIVWVFVVLVLQSSYIASLTSILTVEQLQPDFTDIHDLIRQGNKVGYKEGSFVAQMLKDMGFQDAKLVGYDSLQDYDNALSNKSVSAIFDELPYLNLFLAGHCNKYIMVGPTYKSAGFGFAFPKGSPLLPLVSKALLQVTENELNNITDKWLRPKADCSEQDMVSRSGRLSLDSFLGLFLIAGVSSTCALIMYLFIFLYENKDMLLSDGSIRHKLSAIATIFNQEKHEESKQALTDDNNNNSNNNNVLVIEDNINNPPPTPEHHQASDDDESEATPAHDVVEESRH